MTENLKRMRTSTSSVPKLVREEAIAFQRSTLSNGLRVVTESIPFVRSVSVGAWIFVGSRDERVEEAGISHFIEHMVFKGTEKRKTHHVAQWMESVGGFLNAFTGKEYTCFYARGLDEHLGRAIDIVTDIVLRPSFPTRELDKEKDVVIEEMKMYDDSPEDLIFDQFEGVVYGKHVLGRPVIGTPQSVAGLNRDDLVSFVNRQYTADRMVISVAGNVTHEQVVREVEKAFESFDRKPGRRRRTKPPMYTPKRTTEPNASQQAHLVIGTRAVSAFDDERLSLIVLNTLLGGGMSSRLNQRIREQYGFCYSIYSFLNMFTDSGDFGVYTATDPSRIDKSRSLIQRELDRVTQSKISARELAQAKSQVKGAIMLGLESMSNRMMRIGRQELLYKRHHSMDEVLQLTESITADSILDAAQRILGKADYSEVLFVPDDSIDNN